MRARRSLLVALLVVGPIAWAHFPIVTPSAPFARKGEKTALTVAFGHPFEGDRAPAPPPAAVRVVAPSDAVHDLTPALSPRGGDADRRWVVEFTPAERGDHVFVVEGAPHPHEGAAVVDLTKVVVNVSGVQQGWDRVLGLAVELEPLTRPYGLPVGATFRARARVAGEPAEGVRVEVEHLSPEAPAEIPPEPFVTRVEKSGVGGELAVTLDRPGWWILSFAAAAGEVDVAGERLPRHARANLWVYVGR